MLSRPSASAQLPAFHRAPSAPQIRRAQSRPARRTLHHKRTSPSQLISTALLPRPSLHSRFSARWQRPRAALRPMQTPLRRPLTTLRCGKGRTRRTAEKKKKKEKRAKNLLPPLSPSPSFPPFPLSLHRSVTLTLLVAARMRSFPRPSWEELSRTRYARGGGGAGGARTAPLRPPAVLRAVAAAVAQCRAGAGESGGRPAVRLRRPSRALSAASAGKAAPSSASASSALCSTALTPSSPGSDPPALTQIPEGTGISKDVRTAVMIAARTFIVYATAMYAGPPCSVLGRRVGWLHSSCAAGPHHRQGKRHCAWAQQADRDGPGCHCSHGRARVSAVQGAAGAAPRPCVPTHTNT